MSNLYELNKTINDLLPKVAQKHGIKIEIEDSEKLIKDDSKLGAWDQPCFYTAIQSPQIKQILLALKDVLGINPEIESLSATYKYDHEGWDCLIDFVPKTKSDALCAEWLDGLTPLIDREPETVLTQLIDVLNKLLD